jgi:hypothetical protein
MLPGWTYSGGLLPKRFGSRGGKRNAPRFRHQISISYPQLQEMKPHRARQSVRSLEVEGESAGMYDSNCPQGLTAAEFQSDHWTSPDCG